VPIRTSRLAAIAAAATVAAGGIGGAALAHGGTGGGDDRPATSLSSRCTVPAADLLTTADSRYLRRLDRALDRRVARGKLTQARADRLFARAATRLSVETLVAEARIAPVLRLLGVDLAGLRASQRKGVGIRALARRKGVTAEQLVAAIRQGRADGRALRAQLCPRPPKGGTTTGGTTTEGTTTEGTTTGGTTTEGTTTEDRTTTTSAR
jgi:hypothetical protein